MRPHVHGQGGTGRWQEWDATNRRWVWSRGSYCRVYHNAAQSIPDNALTILAFNSEREDTDGVHSTVTNNSRLTPPVGVYVVAASIRFANNATGYRGVFLKVNGATYISVGTVAAVNGNTTDVLTLSPPYRFNGTDYVEVEVIQNSGGALNVATGANFSPEFGLWRVGV
jgi:hypothetical protein